MKDRKLVSLVEVVGSEKMKGNNREKLKCLLQWIQVCQEKVRKQCTMTKWEEKRTSRWRESRRGKENEKFMDWGRGVAQTRENEEKVADYLHEVGKPLAWYHNDVHLDTMLKH